MKVNAITKEISDHTPEEIADFEAARASEGPAAPRRQEVACGFVILSGGAISNIDGYGFSSAVRVAAGRIRLYFDAPQPDTNYFALATVRHTTSLSPWISNKNMNYVEVRSTSEAMEYVVEVMRILR